VNLVKEQEMGNGVRDISKVLHWHVIVCIVRILHSAQNKHCLSGRRTFFLAKLSHEMGPHLTSSFVRLSDWARRFNYALLSEGNMFLGLTAGTT
jgi:hypothetical protein